MSSLQVMYTNRLLREIEATPGEYLPTLLDIVRIFRESITLKPAGESFRQGWEEAMQGDTMPVSELWTDM
jgi:hypothetical protein